MPARILVVDDIAVNRKLMEVRLEAAYYSALSASGGEEALEMLRTEGVDLVLLDVMMPGMDGYETCRRIKADPKTHDLPVVFTTSLSQPADRIEGVAAGADDFLIKPVADLPLFSRLRSLTRMKQASDDLRVKLGPLAPSGPPASVDDLARPASVVVVCDEHDRHGLRHAMRRNSVTLSVRHDVEGAIAAAEQSAELVVVDLTAQTFDPLVVCSRLRLSPATRQLPILVAGFEDDSARIWKALDLGADDYVPMPVDRFELLTRAGTHIRRRRQNEAMKSAVHSSAEMVFVDPLTGLGNRRALEDRLAEFVVSARRGSRRFSILVADLDHFKRINDRFGHPVGDLVLRQFADRLASGVRGNDVACRFGGEEFVVLLDGADEAMARIAGERLRENIRGIEIELSGVPLDLTVSVGVAEWQAPEDGPALLTRADKALYEAKRAGRDRVEAAPGAASTLTIDEDRRRNSVGFR